MPDAVKQLRTALHGYPPEVIDFCCYLKEFSESTFDVFRMSEGAEMGPLEALAEALVEAQCDPSLAENKQKIIALMSESIKQGHDRIVEDHDSYSEDDEGLLYSVHPFDGTLERLAVDIEKRFEGFDDFIGVDLQYKALGEKERLENDFISTYEIEEVIDSDDAWDSDDGWDSDNGLEVEDGLDPDDEAFDPLMVDYNEKYITERFLPKLKEAFYARAVENVLDKKSTREKEQALERAKTDETRMRRLYEHKILFSEHERSVNDTQIINIIAEEGKFKPEDVKKWWETKGKEECGLFEKEKRAYRKLKRAVRIGATASGSTPAREDYAAGHRDKEQFS